MSGKRRSEVGGAAVRGEIAEERAHLVTGETPTRTLPVGRCNGGGMGSCGGGKAGMRAELPGGGQAAVRLEGAGGSSW